MFERAVSNFVYLQRRWKIAEGTQLHLEKITRITRQRNHVLRRQYVDTISRFKAEQMYCLDE